MIQASTADWPKQRLLHPPNHPIWLAAAVPGFEPGGLQHAEMGQAQISLSRAELLVLAASRAKLEGVGALCWAGVQAAACGDQSTKGPCADSLPAEHAVSASVGPSGYVAEGLAGIIPTASQFLAGTASWISLDSFAPTCSTYNSSGDAIVIHTVASALRQPQPSYPTPAAPYPNPAATAPQ